MIKDFFYFNRSQRIGIVVMLVLILVTVAGIYLMPLLFPVQKVDDPGFQKEVARFEKSLIDRDSDRQAEWEKKKMAWQQQYEQKYKFDYHEKKYVEHDQVKYQLFTFDPNTLDSSGFVKLGLKSFIASNIMKFRKKGGRFKVAGDFEKVYGLFPEKFKELEPYIRIEERVEVVEKSVSKKSDVIVDLNSADTALLMQVKGIGRGYAKGIVRFRQSTGGFVSVDQLSEIYGMRPENIEKIRPYCTVNTSLVQKIRVNTASVDRMKSHPYINFYRAKVIYELRRKKGKLRDVNDLKESPEFTDQDLIRLKPYLNFD